jgi:hypothetical protein
MATPHNMSTVAITDYTFPNLDLEQAILTAAGAQLRSGNDKQVSALKQIVAQADAVITQCRSHRCNAASQSDCSLRNWR